jgi:hypothetical protein
MTASDTIPQYPSAPQSQSASIVLFRALFPNVNPFSEDDNEQFLRALHHKTGGSEEGLALADELLSQRDDYPGIEELASKWRSYNDSTEEPVTLGAIRETFESYGFDWIEICSSAEPDFEPIEPDVQPPITPPAPPSPLDKFSLKGQRSQLLQDAIRQVFALEPLALTGQATVLFSPPNTGKTLIALHSVADAISGGTIDPAKLYYCNADDSQAGLLEKLEHSDEYGYHTIAEGHQGFSTGRFLKILDELTANDQANGVILILDTGKKFFDPMSKRQGRAFGKHVRLFVMKGGTIIVLSHTNKHRDSEGKPIYAGTSDIVEDFDCAYIMYEAGIDADAETKTILLENIKNRGIVARQASYRYSIAEGLSYREILDSVESVDDTELAALQQSEVIKSDAKLIDAVIACIQDGINTKLKLTEAVAERSDISRRAANKILEKYSGSDPDRHRWNFQVRERGAKEYCLLAPDSAINDHAVKP